MKNRPLLLLAGCLAAANIGAAPARLQIEPGQRASIDGVVLENWLGCRRDLSCYLRLEVAAPGGPMAVRVIYHPGEGAPCASEAPPHTGEAITAGQRIRARGHYRLAANVHLIDVCSSPADRLKVVP